MSNTLYGVIGLAWQYTVMKLHQVELGFPLSLPNYHMPCVSPNVSGNPGLAGNPDHLSIAQNMANT